MKRILLSLIFAILITNLYAQEECKLKMISEHTDNEDLQKILHFEGIDFFKIKFIGGEELKTKGYCIRAKEFKDGVLVSDTSIFDTKLMGYERLETINDTILNFSVLARKTVDNKLRVMFYFPTFSIAKEFETIDTEDSYSLRNIAAESNLPINYNENFYLLAYILPYDMGNGYKSYCEVGRNGGDIENWGKKFGIKHYLVFEMNIE